VDRWAVEVTVANVVWVLRRVSMDTSVAGNSIFAGGAEIRIIPDCTPLMPTLVLWAAVAAFPARWHYKVLGLLVGAAAVWAFNLLRVFALMAVLAWMPQHFKFVHVYLWQTGTLLVVIALFVLWIQTEPRVPAPG
jgi:exosortase/archaeosortase family protein